MQPLLDESNEAVVPFDPCERPCAMQAVCGAVGELGGDANDGDAADAAAALRRWGGDETGEG